MTHQPSMEPGREASSPLRSAEPVGTASRVAADPPVAAVSPPWTGRSLAVLLAGALVAGGVAGGTLALTSGPQGSEIEQIAPADLASAMTSFPRAELGTHVEDAKACRVPLAYVTLVPRNGSTGHVRIRSGDYWTPVIHLGNAPLRVALPFPAPYPAGIGQFEVEGDSAAFDMYLRPGWVGGTVNGSATVHVWWHVRAPC